MSTTEGKVAELLQEAGETHHRVYRIVDGADDDWASWYADWLIRLSELPELLGTTPVRSELVYMLVGLAKEYDSAGASERWQDYYARGLIQHFPPGPEPGPGADSGTSSTPARG